jgi:hypothetical protein
MYVRLFWLDGERRGRPMKKMRYQMMAACVFLAGCASSGESTGGTPGTAQALPFTISEDADDRQPEVRTARMGLGQRWDAQWGHDMHGHQVVIAYLGSTTTERPTLLKSVDDLAQIIIGDQDGQRTDSGSLGIWNGDAQWIQVEMAETDPTKAIRRRVCTVFTWVSSDKRRVMAGTYCMTKRADGKSAGEAMMREIDVHFK